MRRWQILVIPLVFVFSARSMPAQEAHERPDAPVVEQPAPPLPAEADDPPAVDDPEAPAAVEDPVAPADPEAPPAVDEPEPVPAVEDPEPPPTVDLRLPPVDEEIDAPPMLEPVVPLEEPEDPALELYEDVMVLSVIRTLNLGPMQLEQLRQIAEIMAAEREAFLQLRQQTWAGNREAIERVINAWLEWAAPSVADQRVADAAVDGVRIALSEYNRLVMRAAQAFYGILTEDQRRLVENPLQVEQRMLLQGTIGAQSIGEWMVSYLDTMRTLMPEEFQMLAGSEAERLSRIIVGDVPNLPAVAEGVLDILIQVYGWPPLQYQQQRDTLPIQIEAMLGIEGLAERPPVMWEDVVWLVGSIRMPTVIAELTGAGGGGEQ